MVEWLRRRYIRDIKCFVHELEVMGSKPCRVERRVSSISI